MSKLIEIIPSTEPMEPENGRPSNYQVSNEFLEDLPILYRCENNFNQFSKNAISFFIDNGYYYLVPNIKHPDKSLQENVPKYSSTRIFVYQQKGYKFHSFDTLTDFLRMHDKVPPNDRHFY